MNTPELPEPIFDNGEDLTPEIELPTQPDPVYNPLFENLVPEEPETRIAGRLSFADAMPRMGMSSVFDIIRQPKGEFARQLRTLSDADGEMAYDNALCYATQIARSYREDVVSSGRDLPLIVPQTGVRALVDIGPSYPNLFKENWDQFCKVGAIEAMDGPVAYLASLRRFAAEKIEGASTSPRRIPLALRRPDLDKLVIDEQSTYQSRPMLDLVNDVLTQGIDKYQAEKGDARPIHQLLAEKKHPFVFPYHFAHQQVSLALAQQRTGLGELNYTLGNTGSLPGQPVGSIDAAGDKALATMSGLSPSLQKILLAPSDFSHFYVSLRSLLNDQRFYSLGLESLRTDGVGAAGFLLPAQRTLSSVTPTANSLTSAGANQKSEARVVFLRNGSPNLIVRLDLQGQDRAGGYRGLMNNSTKYQGSNSRALIIGYTGTEQILAELGELTCEVVIQARSRYNLEPWKAEARSVADWKITFMATHDYTLTPSQQAFFKTHYGAVFTHMNNNPLIELERFLHATGLHAQQAEALLAVNACAPVTSASYRTSNRSATAFANFDPFPWSNHYGACYVNGVGGTDTRSADFKGLNTAMGLTQTDDLRCQISHSTLERFDRLQRMIRLQAATQLPFAELDTLITAAMRSEGDANPNLDINANTLRVLGTFRYFQKNYTIDAEEFAAFVYRISPHATKGQIPLLDKIFDSAGLFGGPLVLDSAAFSANGSGAANRQTIAQLRGGLRIDTDAEFASVAADTIAHVADLARNLTTVSSLYRQTRIAQMLGLSITHFHTLVDLLGGTAYREVIANGRLKPVGSAGKDILDVLMALDGTVRWLKDHKLHAGDLVNLLQAPAATLTQGIVDQLQQLAADAHANALTAQTIKALGLPADATGHAIDWWEHLRASPELIDSYGLVKDQSWTFPTTDNEQIAALVQSLILRLNLALEDRASTAERLTGYLANTSERQNRLSEGFWQSTTGLLPELAALCAQAAEITTAGLLHIAMLAWPLQQPPADDYLDTFALSVSRVMHIAKVIQWCQFGPTALGTMMANNNWLSDDTLWPLTFKTLHRLKAYETLLNTLGQPEEHLLGYLQQANALFSKRPGKRQIAMQAQTCNAALARLLGWSESEVAVLTALLPQQTAKTVAHIDWVRRAQALAMDTGLNAATLLQACALNADSPDADWQAVGQAAMAALR
ncbi:Tc toxin subunit A [Pseudomonas coleopterorum]|uniref:Tc toxin subunit A n=1 Tax=Pseudomonas coleopterorum TaxID=1605838 RepID=UPI002A6AAB45|nr:Tc toxin subunit A [Pseudomonas coleopterorum]MDY1018202.1 Tc toxin subunit A [Pseudomonas coleopterorum]